MLAAPSAFLLTNGTQQKWWHAASVIIGYRRFWLPPFLPSFTCWEEASCYVVSQGTKEGPCQQVMRNWVLGPTPCEELNPAKQAHELLGTAASCENQSQRTRWRLTQFADPLKLYDNNCCHLKPLNLGGSLLTTQFPIAPIGVCNYTCGWGLQEKLSLQGSMCSRWVKGKKGVLCLEKSAKARERQMLEMAVSLGAACHSGCSAGYEGWYEGDPAGGMGKGVSQRAFHPHGAFGPCRVGPCFSQINNIWISSKGKCLR